MSNNNEAADEADNNNEREHRENNQNQNNPPEWGAFPDLLRVQEPQQNGGGPEAAGVMQRAGTSNPPDVSLPGAAGRDPPPPDFDLVIQSGNQNQRLPDMALDANQAQQHRSLPDMALDASGLPRERPAAASGCGGARFRPRRAPNGGGSPGSLAQMAQAAAGGGADNGIDPQSHQDPINARFHELEEQVQALRMHVYETDRMRSEEASRILDELASLRRSIDVTPRENPALENRLINIESLIQRMVAPRAEASEEANRAYRARELQRQQRETERLSRLLAESLHLALTHFMQQLGNVDRAENDDQPEL